VETHANFLRAQRQAATAKDAPSQAALRQAEERMNALWKKWPQIQRAVAGAAAVPLIGEVAYQLALAKHEQAERLQARLDPQRNPAPELAAAAREAWQAAAERWRIYLSQPSPAADAAACLNRARALAALDDRPGARALLESAIPNQRGWNQKALQYALLQLQEK
jgi:hypothetical protein